jgi:hypothetical protein
MDTSVKKRILYMMAVVSAIGLGWMATAKPGRPDRSGKGKQHGDG